MSSIIKGYSYDIFISYRQKDNKHDGWVTEFANHLKGELESTFKEEVSVYFDINPHDGLLETHDVDASLKEKLKCLIFIPVISRTYCDPRSFAWEHEFKAFIEQASHDQFGLKIKLPNGNVANRVLPVRIHDLDSEDIKLCESVLGGVLRGIEFIYKSPGVNRPLRAEEESPNDNLNKTFYRDQINKVALAIKEIILGLKNEPVEHVKEKPEHREPVGIADKEEREAEKEKPVIWTRKKLLSAAAIIAILALVVVLVYPKLFKKSILEKLRSADGKISVAVMPFQNLTNDTIWNIWQGGIQNELITNLTNSEDLKVRQIETVNSLLQSRGLTNYASIVPSVASIISQKLEASVLIYGSINQEGNTVRVNTQLIDSKNEEVIKSFQVKSPAREEMIFNIIDSLSGQVKDFLIITQLRKGSSINNKYVSPTNSPEAYRYFMHGQNAFNRTDFTTAANMYLQAIAIDSNFYSAITMLSVAYYNQYQHDLAKKWCLKVYEKRNQMPISQNIHINWLYAMLFETPNEEIKYLNQFLELDDQYPPLYYELGRIYVALDQYDKAISAMTNALDIYKKWGSKPRWANDYVMLGFAYHETDRYRKEKRLYKKAEQDFPDDAALIQRQAILLLTEKDTITANRYIEKFITIMKNNSVPEIDIAPSLAYLYTEAGFLNKAEKCYRDILSQEPEHPSCLNNLGWFLIANDRNINEGMELIDKALKIRPNSYRYLENKGLGLYKLGKYKEAVEVLEKSWKLRPVYDHSSYLFLEKVKKAAASLK
jgi:tetratricopeptide (TPR) repeat protein